MKITIRILFFLILVGRGQAQSIPTDKSMWTFKGGYTYNFEWTNEQYDDNFVYDTLYVIQFFPKSNNWKVYFDKQKKSVATLYRYDTIQKTINTKHYDRQGKLIKELEANYVSRKSYNPGFIKIKNVINLKSYINDSVVCEIKGFKTSLLIQYKNHRTKKHFEKRIYYRESEMSDEEIGENYTEYYENGNIKQTCNSYIEERTDNIATVAVLISDCKDFDSNGCIIKKNKVGITHGLFQPCIHQSNCKSDRSGFNFSLQLHSNIVSLFKHLGRQRSNSDSYREAEPNSENDSGNFRTTRMTTNIWIEKGWGDSVENATFEDIKNAIEETIKMDEEHGAFWVGHRENEFVLEVHKNFDLFFVYGENQDEQIQIKLDNWEDVKHFFKLYFDSDFEKLKSEIEMRPFTYKKMTNG